MNSAHNEHRLVRKQQTNNGKTTKTMTITVNENLRETPSRKRNENKKLETTFSDFSDFFALFFFAVFSLVADIEDVRHPIAK